MFWLGFLNPLLSFPSKRSYLREHLSSSEKSCYLYLFLPFEFPKYSPLRWYFDLIQPVLPGAAIYILFVKGVLYFQRNLSFLFLHKSYFYFKFILREHPSPSRSCYLYLVVKGVLDFHSGNNNGCFRIKILLTWIYWEIDYNRLILNNDDHHYVRLVWVQLVARPKLFWICSHNGSLLNDDYHH